ncbi:hypothetical protein CEXT_507761 [Caerostris extrusa]|uniref:Uncharacterized protein n=1 Tax=Caerostris extrusa TaxID=172846 RepID=A0AAV4XEG6_CAEEX|nr:hypothetical protein CEXT_507761 [Caerostris extrusa]
MLYVFIYFFIFFHALFCIYFATNLPGKVFTQLFSRYYLPALPDGGKLPLLSSFALSYKITSRGNASTACFNSSSVKLSLSPSSRRLHSQSSAADPPPSPTPLPPFPPRLTSFLNSGPAVEPACMEVTSICFYRSCIDVALLKEVRDFAFQENL